jgi:F0F1-type ATP synthase assembly protein I
MSQLDPSSMSRRQQIVETYRMTKEADPAVGLVVAVTFLLGAIVGGVLFWLLPTSGVLGIIFIVIGAVLFGTVAALLIFSRRAQKAAYARIEGQPGAAAAALNMLRRGWTVTPAVGFNKNQDVVHRVVGPPGLVLVAEGTSPSRVRALLATERTKHQRVLPETPITEILAGNGEGEVPLPKLVSHVTKLKRQVKPAEITDILYRLKALDAQRGTLPLPKGPVPTSMKGQRGNLRGR